MAITYFPFDAGAGANVSEDQWRQMARLWRETGVIPDEGDEFLVTESSPAAMSVDVGTGIAWLRGHFMESDTEEIKIIGEADPVNPRIDRVILRVDFGNNTMSVEVLEGTPAATPAAPALEQSSSTWEISLARIAINAAGSSIETVDITDERPYSLTSGDPIGKEVDFMATSPPTGYIALDGVDRNRFTFARLFAEVGTTYGAGDGSTTFGIRDARGRVTVGLGTHADVDTLADNDGVAVGSRRPAHRHVANTGPSGDSAAGTTFSTRDSAPTSSISLGQSGMTDEPAYGVALRCVRAR